MLYPHGAQCDVPEHKGQGHGHDTIHLEKGNSLSTCNDNRAQSQDSFECFTAHVTFITTI